MTDERFREIRRMLVNAFREDLVKPGAINALLRSPGRSPGVQAVLDSLPPEEAREYIERAEAEWRTANA